jgi:hypothetical protein
MNYLCISWWNDYDLGDILYQDGYKNKIFLDVEVEKPEYNTVIESDLNGDSVEITKFRKSEKVYKFECWMQEDLVDAFALMQIHDNIEVTLQSGDVIQVQKHGLRAEPSWEEIGCLAKVNVSFTENYVIAGNCDENKDLGCLCDDSGGDFSEIIEYSNIGSITPSDGLIVLAWTVEDLANKKYTAKLYEFSYAASNWIELAQPPQYTCWQNLTDGTTWIWDGQFWQLFPGYITYLAIDAGIAVEIQAYLIPGAFGTVQWLGGIGWISAGSYSADELDSGVIFDIIESGNIDVRVKVWNHSCDYGYTEEETIVMP